MPRYQVGRITGEARAKLANRIGHRNAWAWGSIAGFDPVTGEAIAPDGSRRRFEASEFEAMRFHEITGDLITVGFANGDRIKARKPFWTA